MVYSDLSQISLFSQAGVTACQYAINDSGTGLPMGPTGTITAGQSRGLAAYIAIKEATDNISEPRVINVTGANGSFRQQYIFLPADLGTLQMGFGAFSQDAYAAFSDTKIEALGDFNIVGFDTNVPPASVQATLLFTADIQDAGSLHFGQAAFSNYFYPSVTVVPLARTMSEVTAMAWNFRGTPNQVTKAPWAKAFTTVTNGFLKAKCLQLTSRNPLTMQTIVADGSTTEWSLDYSPDSDGTGYTFYAFRYQSNGTVTQITPSSVDIAAKTVTFPDVYVSGDVIQVLYSSFDLLASM
jgi:hypothetical protein